MRHYYIAFILFLITCNCATSQTAIKYSPFVGHWDWVENDHKNHSFYISAGERNDSLLFAIGGIFYHGEKIHMPNYDNNYIDIATVKAAIPKGNKVRSKISILNSNFYSGPNDANKYNPVSLELLNDTTMLFILNDNKPYWPDTAIMRRRDYINHTFSQEEDYYLYKE